MAGAKDRKGETSSSGPRSGGNGGGGAVCGVNEKGALFPRLDVKETRRDGPRAPPRNKMALYEQFTFPSHRFVPPSLPLPAAARPTVSKSTSYDPQQSPHEMSMRYIPASFGSMPWMPYSAMKTVPQQSIQPSLNCSSNSTVVDGEVDFQQRRGPPANEKARPSSSVTEHDSRLASSRSYQSSMSRKTTRYNDDCLVPSYVPQSFSAHGLSRRSGEGSRGGGHQHGVETSSTGQPASTSSEVPVDSSSRLGKGRPSEEVYSHSMRTREDKEAERDHASKAENKDREGESKLQGNVDVLKENDCPLTKKGHSGRAEFQCNSTEQRSSQHHGQPKDSLVEATSGLDRHKNPAARGGCLSASENAGEPDAPQPEMNLGERRGTERSPGRESPSSKFDERGKSKNETRPRGPKSKKRPTSSACKSNGSSHSDDEMEVASGADAPEKSLSEAWSDGADSDASMAGSKSPKKQRKLTSRDIINSLGEQEFWKTRRMIQRQQQIFESQVFELHRLVQVQKLLASSADASMDDNDTGDPAEKAEGIPEPVQLQEAVLQDKAAQDPETQSRDQEMHEDVPVQPESACHSSSAKVCLQPSPGDPPLAYANGGQAPAAPDATQEGSAASWGCSPFPQAADAGNWCAPVVAPSGTYMYDSYPMSFHAPPHHAMGAYGGAYRPVMYSPSPLNVPGMTPYGMPRYDQRPDVVHDMYRYNGYRPQWPPAMFCGPVGSNPGGGWYGVPPTMPYMNQSLRGAYGWYEGMAAGGHPSSTLNGVGHGHLSGMQGMPVPPFVVQPPWVSASNDQQPSCDGDNFQRQMAWGASADSSHMPSLGFRPLERPSGMDSGEPPPPRSNERGLSEVAQIPNQGGFKRLLPRASGRPCSISALQQAGGELNFDWGNPEARNFRGHEHRPPQPLLDSQSLSPDELEERTSKRSRCDGHEGNELEDTDETSSRLETSNPIEGQINALPLFPLAPALHPAEDERTSSRSSEVIKVVPRAMVATAESAAEILMSIQTRRQQ